MTHDELRELIAAYAVDILTGNEARELESHLAVCEDCRRDLASFRDTAAALGAGVAPSEPPPALRDRVLASVREGFPRSRPGRAVPTAVWVALTAAAVLIVSLGTLSVSLEQQLSVLRVRTATQAQLTTLLASPSTRTVALRGSIPGNVRFVFDPVQGRGALIADGMGDPGAGRVYQLWLVAGTTPASAGIFRPQPGQPIILPVTAAFTLFHAVAISVERSPNGAASPTAAPILVGTLPGTS